MLRSIIATVILAATASTPPTSGPAHATVKMSSSGICHCPGGTFYDRTRNFAAHASVDACLMSGGRHPSRGQGQCMGGDPQSAHRPAAQTNDPAPSPAPSHAKTRRAPYDRDLFGGWADVDRDCRNTRHELLAELSTGRIRMSHDGCRVVSGRWSDPYTNRIYTASRDLDVDHVVPLAYAWTRGADRWDEATRTRFANDPANLFAVQASAHRQKGAKGPTEWMPPHEGFHCQYLLRFTRVSLAYELVFSAGEARAIDAMTGSACDG